MKTQNLLHLFSIILIFASCSPSEKLNTRDYKWSKYFTDKEQENILYIRAENHYKRGKKYLDLKLLKRAQSEFQFLYFEFKNKNAEKLLEGTNRFIEKQIKEYKSLARQTKDKNLIFTTAGYYRNVLRLSPTDPESKGYLNDNKGEIVKRLDTNLKFGYRYIKSNEFGKAKRCFKRILVFDPKNPKAIKGIQLIKQKKELIVQQKKIKKRKKSARLELKKIKEKLEREIHNRLEEKISSEYEEKFAAKIEEAINQMETEEPEHDELLIIKEPEVKVKQLDNDEKEKFYQSGLTAYEKKDFLKAYDYFESINDSSYKDTSLYLKRTEDKINTLGLNEDD